MRIAFTSDTHNQVSEKNPDHVDLFSCVRFADVLVHCGDATTQGTAEQIVQFSRWFAGLPCDIKIFVPGNHDKLFESDEMKARHLLDSSITCLINESLVLNGVSFYGSPIVPSFGQWAFGLARGSPEMRKARDEIPHCDVLITHGPPSDVLDFTSHHMEHAGCWDLYRRVANDPPKVHAFGHVHDGYGAKYDMRLCTMFLNVACCDPKYRPVNRPLIVEV